MAKPAAATQINVRAIREDANGRLVYTYRSANVDVPANGDIRVDRPQGGGGQSTTFTWICPQEFELEIEEFTPTPPGNAGGRSNAFMRKVWNGESPCSTGELYKKAAQNTAAPNDWSLSLTLDANRSGEYKYTLRVKQADGSYITDDPRIIVD